MNNSNHDTQSYKDDGWYRKKVQKFFDTNEPHESYKEIAKGPRKLYCMCIVFLRKIRWRWTTQHVVVYV